MNANTKPHLGRNIGRLRELRGMKQFALAEAIGVTQQAISHLENSEIIDEQKLQQIADVLGVTTEAIKNFNDENLITYFNHFYDNSSGHGFGNYHSFSFNPIDKLIEMFEENKQLYIQMLQYEKDKNLFLEKLLENKQ